MDHRKVILTIQVISPSGSQIRWFGSRDQILREDDLRPLLFLAGGVMTPLPAHCSRNRSRAIVPILAPWRRASRIRRRVRAVGGCDGKRCFLSQAPIGGCHIGYQSGVIVGQWVWLCCGTSAVGISVIDKRSIVDFETIRAVPSGEIGSPLSSLMFCEHWPNCVSYDGFEENILNCLGQWLDIWMNVRMVSQWKISIGVNFKAPKVIFWFKTPWSEINRPLKVAAYFNHLVTWA
jgi:hypothetical protein